MDNLEILATLCTQDTGQINIRENRRAIRNGTSRDTGNTGYITHRTKTNTTKSTTHKAKLMSNTDHTKIRG